jgi:hypothetical protein
MKKHLQLELFRGGARAIADAKRLKPAPATDQDLERNSPPRASGCGRFPFALFGSFEVHGFGHGYHAPLYCQGLRNNSRGPFSLFNDERVLQTRGDG